MQHFNLKFFTYPFTKGGTKKLEKLIVEPKLLYMICQTQKKTIILNLKDKPRISKFTVMFVSQVKAKSQFLQISKF